MGHVVPLSSVLQVIYYVLRFQGLGSVWWDWSASVSLPSCLFYLFWAVFKTGVWLHFFSFSFSSQVLVPSWLILLVTRESLNPKPHSFGKNPGNTWNSRSASPKFLKVPRRRINSFTFFFCYFYYFLSIQRQKKKNLNPSNSPWPSTTAPSNLLWPRGCDLSACWLQTDPWKANAVREASTWWHHRPKTPSGKTVKSPLLLLSRP